VSMQGRTLSGTGHCLSSLVDAHSDVTQPAMPGIWYILWPKWPVEPSTLTMSCHKSEHSPPRLSVISALNASSCHPVLAHKANESLCKKPR